MEGIKYKGIMKHTNATMCYDVPHLSTNSV